MKGCGEGDKSSNTWVADDDRLALLTVGDANEAVAEGNDVVIVVGEGGEAEGGGGVVVAVGEDEAVAELKVEKGGGVTVVERDKGWVSDEGAP